MNAGQLSERFNLTVKAGQNGLDREVTGGHCGDLLSEVMANAPIGCVWMTIQCHPNIVAVAVLREMAAIIICNENVPDDDTLKKADQEGIPLLVSSESSFALAGKIYAAGIENAG